jgi:hypothetical protein
MGMDIELAWNGPYSWFGDGSPPVFVAPAAARSGLYAWSAAMTDGDWVYYVGQTTKSFGDRHWEHWREYASGAYGIHDPAAFYAGRHQLAYKGFAYRRPAHVHFASFVASLDEHLSTAVSFLRPMRIWLAELPADRRLQRRLESAVIRALYQQPGPARAFQEPGMRTEPMRAGEAPLRVQVRSPCALVGLPQEFDA